MAVGKKTGGRKAGTKNLKTQGKEAALKTALVGARAAVVAAKVDAKPAKAPKDKSGVEVAPAGISAKDLMLAAMRNAWAQHKVEGARSSSLMDKYNEMADAALALTIIEGEKPDQHQARIAAALAVADLVKQQAVGVRIDAGAALGLALDCAHKVAPFDHAKLQTATVQGDLQLNVTIRKF